MRRAKQKGEKELIKRARVLQAPLQVESLGGCSANRTKNRSLRYRSGLCASLVKIEKKVELGLEMGQCYNPDKPEKARESQKKPSQQLLKGHNRVSPERSWDRPSI